jgi:hypothetical protein
VSLDDGGVNVEEGFRGRKGDIKDREQGEKSWINFIATSSSL